jgi:transcriptional regulator with XRE-family HTH domain
MDNTQVANRIKELCKLKGSSVSKMLEVCNIRKSLIYDLEKRNASPSIEVIGQIADYLNCSVDYLLGRTDSPTVSGNYINGDNNVQAIRTGNGDMTIHAEKQLSKGIDPTTEEFIKIFCDLDFDDKFEVMQLLMQKRGEKK